MSGSLAELMVSIIGDVSDVRRAFDEVDKSTGALGKSMTSLGNDMSNIGKSMSMYITAPLALMGAGAFKVAADFDDSMRQVQAVTGETGDSLDTLREAALQMGADTAFSSSQAADAMLQLGQAGFTAEEILISTNDVLSLASAGALDLGTAAGITANAMNGFGLEAQDTQRIVDILAMGASISTTSVEGLGNALSYVAPVAHAMGMSIEETTSLIAGLSNAGIEGERAGTALRGAISALARPTDQMAVIFGKYKIALDKVNPATNSFTEILGVLEAAGMSASDVMAIFGQEAGPGVLALLGQGTGAIKEQTLALQNSEGAAQQMAETMEGGVGGAMRQLQGSVETLAIELGDLIAVGLKPVIDFATKLFNAISELPSPFFTLVVAMAGLAAAIGPVLIVAGTLISSIGTITTAIAGAGGLSAVLGGLVAALTGPVAIAIAAFAAAAYVVYKNWDTVGPQVISVFNRIRDSIQPLIEQVQVFISNALDRLRMWWATNGPAIQQAATTVFNTIAGVIGWLVDNVLPHMVSMFQSHFNTVTSILQYVGSFIGNVIMLVVHLINGDWSAAWTSARDIVSTVWEAIKGIVSAAINSVLNTISSVMASIRTTVQTIWTAILGIVTGVLTSISGNVSNIWNSILNTITSVLNNIRNTSQTTWNSIHSTISNIINSIQNTITSAWNTILNTARSTFDSIRSAISERLNSILSAIQNIIERIKSIWSSGLGDLVGIASSVMGKVASAISGSGSSLASAASSAGQKALDALSSKLKQMQAIEDQMKKIQSISSSFSSSSSSSSSKSSSSSGSSGPGWTGSAPTSKNAPYDQPSQSVKKEKHATGGIAGYTGWHWMEENELAVPEKFDWDGVLTSSLSKALKSVASSGVSNSYAGDTTINVNATLTPQYNFEALMRDIERELSKNKTRRGILS